ncbi:MAG: GNAT family N-acetyltransferase [Acidobacteria bacterium]|nr:GNAT family N-acetyltransferase [Acidobacteriota bacterium]
MIAVATTDDEIQNCYAVMAELRPHIKPEEFLPQVKRQAENSGYELTYLTDGEVKAVGGFRISEWLSGGKYLEIEDLVAKSGERSKGYGGELFDWLIEHAKENNCNQVKLVSHVKRFGAHRFYLQKRMDIQAHYFSLNLKS